MKKSIEIVIDKNGNVTLDLQNIPVDEHSITHGIENTLGTVAEKVVKAQDGSISVREQQKITIKL